ncbi:DUF2624 family protein [Salipaludibacillus sp. HK11]|uniref:DUF2624 family protein n=1 Tax=Salipaludibacillus sp. HK11 TaxID=3394320 RepID=UPI0039FB9D17
MNSVIQDIINQKVRQLTLKELIKLCQQEGIPLTVKDGRRILAILQRKPFDIADKKRIKSIRKQLQQEFPSQYKHALVLLKPYEHYLE